jgi:hypothetical protein
MTEAEIDETIGIAWASLIKLRLRPAHELRPHYRSLNELRDILDEIEREIAL